MNKSKELHNKDTSGITETNQEKDAGGKSEISLSQWERCHCELATCNSCVAERLAIVDDSGYHGLCPHRRAELGMNNPMSNVNTAVAAATVRQMASSCYRHMTEPAHDQVTEEFRVMPAPGNDYDSLFVYWSHSTIADSTIDGRTEFSYASAIVVLRFACAFAKQPSVVTYTFLPNEVCCQVKDAMRKGNACYESLYQMQPLELGPDDTLEVCSDLRLKEVYRQDIYHNCLYNIADYIVNLNPGQLLLVYRHKPYKVLSVVCTADPNAVCLFDSQVHRQAYVAHDGAILFFSRKTRRLVTMMLAKLQEYVFQFEGKCTLVLLEM